MKTIVIIQARMGSNRLPGKVMMKLGKRPVIDHVIMAVLKADQPTICAIPEGEKDDILAERIMKHPRAILFRGSEENVALRFAQVLHEHPCDAFVRICADSPFIDPKTIRTSIKMLHAHDADYVYTTGYPSGQQVECVKSPLFLETLGTFNAYEREHVTPRFRKPGFKVRVIRKWPGEEAVKLTVDTMDDLERLRAIA